MTDKRVRLRQSIRQTISTLITAASLTTIFFFPVTTHCQDAPVWTAADLTGNIGGISLFRYGALGVGAYPYRTSAPGADMRVSFGGVPLRIRSPFGPDLDAIPAMFAETALYNGWNSLSFALADSIPTEPVTDTRFLMGSRQRFNLDMLYRRALNEQSSLTFGGSSTGMQGHYPPGTDAFIPKFNFRSYLIDYYRRQGNGSRLHVTIRAFRDRDELADLSALIHMGERKIDEATISANLDDVPLSDTTVLSSTVYYIDSNTRFARYGFRKSLDENVLGGRISADKTLGNTTYRLGLFHEFTWLDSRIHKKSDQFAESAVEGAFGYNGSHLTLNLDVAAEYHSDFEDGYRFAADIRYRLSGGVTAIARARAETVYPNPGDLYYVIPSFSDSNHVNYLYRGEVLETETGFDIQMHGVNVEVLAFASRTDCPVFNPDTETYFSNVARDIRFLETPPYIAARTVSVDGLESSGVRIGLSTTFDYWVTWELNSQNAFRVDAGDDPRWYYPQIESRFDGSVRRAFVNDNLQVAGFGTAAFMHWKSPDNRFDTAPYGSRFLLNAGVSIKVATLELFYRIENITSEDIYWFDVFQWQGRNSMYGGRWIFYR